MTTTTERRQRIYLAGPMRGMGQFNFPEFRRVTELLRLRHYDVFSPAERDERVGFDPKDMTGHEDLAEMGFSLRDALGADTEWICREADALVVLDGWERSSGARAEVALARALGLPVWTWRDAIDPSTVNVDITAPTKRLSLQLDDPLPPDIHALADVVLERTDLANEDHHARTASEVMRAGAERDGVTGTSSRFTKDAPGPGRVRSEDDFGTWLRSRTEEVARRRAQAEDDKAKALLEEMGWTPPVADGEPCPPHPHVHADGQVGGEVRVTSSTGGEKGQKLARYDLIPVGPMELVARHYGLGAHKYEDRNWEKGYAWSLSYGALQRHLAAFWSGNDIDTDPSLPEPTWHLAAVVFHALALLQFSSDERRYGPFDDRACKVVAA